LTTQTPLDNDAFQQLADSYRYELIVHCYRILGSIEDAEDALQETLLRAWRRFDTLKQQSAVRAWLYKIATNVALDMLAKAKSRSLPPMTMPSADPEAELPQPVNDPIWLDPLPETYLSAYHTNPETQVEALEYISLAFLEALQRLPGRQRAILLLCDVLDWKAQEAADALSMSLAAVNSALQRARATLKKAQPQAVAASTPINADTKVLLNRYVHAWESADLTSLLALFREDAILTMPPFPMWFLGRGAIGTFLQKVVFAGKNPDTFRLTATTANDAPAFALYERSAGGGFVCVALQVLTLYRGQIARIDDFLALESPLFRRFHLPIPD
jgi:RNA polymerase sigma-70 factor, ECF subfamily